MKRKFLIVCLLAVSQSLIIQAQSYDGDLKESYSDDAIDHSLIDVNKQFELKYKFLNTATYHLASDKSGEDICAEISSPLRSTFSFENEGTALGGIPDPLPDTPIDSTIYVLLIGVLLYGYVAFRKEKKLKL